MFRDEKKERHSNLVPQNEPADIYQKVRISVATGTDRVDPRRSIAGIAPNFIYNLDTAYLV